jgi:hypothetical protein
MADDDEQVVRLADGVSHSLSVATSCHDCVPGGERGSGDVDAHASAGAGDEPDLLSHVLQSIPSVPSRGQRLLRST